jgi:lipoyl-dependent peroxiredoxin
MKTLYTARASATGGREGRVQSDDGKLSFKLDKPGASGEGTNPEQLFACGYAACFSGAAQYIAKQMNFDLGEITVNAQISLNSVEDGFRLSGVMDVSLPDLEREKAVEMVRKTHEFCPYSRATRGNVDVVLKVNGEAI